MEVFADGLCAEVNVVRLHLVVYFHAPFSHAENVSIATRFAQHGYDLGLV
jgi:hypothetical protein